MDFMQSCEPIHISECFMLVGRRGSEVVVYRTTLFDGDKAERLYPDVAEAVRGLSLAHREVVADPDMMWQEAELSIYTTVAA